MMAYEMVGVADQNNRTYESKYGTYNRETGFVLNEVGRSIGKCGILDKMFHENCWSLKQEKPKPKKMTKEEIEEALGYEIEIYDGETRNTVKNLQNTKNCGFNDTIYDLFMNFYKR